MMIDGDGVAMGAGSVSCGRLCIEDHHSQGNLWGWTPLLAPWDDSKPRILEIPHQRWELDSTKAIKTATNRTRPILLTFFLARAPVHADHTCRHSRVWVPPFSALRTSVALFPLLTNRTGCRLCPPSVTSCSPCPPCVVHVLFYIARDVVYTLLLIAFLNWFQFDTPRPTGAGRAAGGGEGGDGSDGEGEASRISPFASVQRSLRAESGKNKEPELREKEKELAKEYEHFMVKIGQLFEDGNGPWQVLNKTRCDFERQLNNVYRKLDLARRPPQFLTKTKVHKGRYISPR